MAGRVAEAVCIAISGPQPNQDWQNATNANCARIGREVDNFVNRDNNTNISSNNSGFPSNTNNLPWYYHEPKASDILMGDHIHCHLSQKDWDARD
ncbi:MAG: hypothetical protein RCO49_09080 [Rickettsia endosymbiont of Argas persicus]